VKVAILGASGTTGALVCKEAFEAGHEAIAFVRNQNALAPRQGLEIVQGSIEDVADMSKAFERADTVISCLGARMTPAFVFEKVDFQRRVLPRVISAINAAKVKRFVLMSSFGIGESADKASVIPRVVIYKIIAKNLFDDKALAERALSDCQANWTAIYPVMLKKGPVDAAWDLVPLDHVRHVPGLPILSFATVAKVLIDVASDHDKNKQKLLLTERGGWQ
jgi:putative NADH-flavin reductase